MLRELGILDGLLEEGEEQLGAMTEMRRTLHQRPELGLHLPITQELVCEQLEGLPLLLTLGKSTTSVVGMLDGGQPGPTVLLRADMDALPMPEDTGLEFASSYEGVMHACGHDAHTSMLVGAARILSGRRSDLAGRVLFMFQPGEEGHHGARYMIDDGLLDPSTAGDVRFAFAIHQTPNVPCGVVASKGGTLLASSDTLRITVDGKGGHASQPHFTLDPIPVACEIVGAIQSLVTRRVDVFDPGVVTIAKIEAGTTSNVIPEKAYLLGTIRTVSEQTRTHIHDGLKRLAEGIAAAHGMGATVEIVRGFPVTVNHIGPAAQVLDVAGRLLGTERAVTMPAPVMGAEDFSYVLQKVPGAMVFLGTRPEGVRGLDVAPNHSNRMVLDERAMATGAALYAAVALDQLS